MMDALSVIRAKLNESSHMKVPSFDRQGYPSLASFKFRAASVRRRLRLEQGAQLTLREFGGHGLNKFLGGKRTA
jgi:hypothetical protein